MNERVRVIMEELQKVILGKEKVIKDIINCILADGNLLLEDVPGVGKTTMVKALARVMDVDFKRIQFTPDLLPSDVTGISVYNQKSGAFEFKKGPIHSNIVLADEINRTSPKTQSSLLEAMQEKQITVDGKTYELPNVFIVMATQNPIEYEGTFNLPEAQIDRFMMKISVGYPDKISEKQIMRLFKGQNPLNKLKSVITENGILDMREEIKNIHISEKLEDYILDIVDKTRYDERLRLGISPRGSIDILKASKAKAYMEDRTYVIPDDIKELSYKVFVHRVILKPEMKIQGITQEQIITDILDSIRVPVVN